ncbi:MAG: methyl-accepting chemotaxis protein, partial [Burkholderiaceae bacterium]
MRRNFPVSRREHPFPPDTTLVSVTDTKGRIVYANAAFVRVSGYHLTELLGQPHNLIRHPDMPEEAFRDLWDTIERGTPWTGLVKNRRKNGDFYWVRANVTPMYDGDEISGYLSVRSEPARAEVDAAEQLYAVMREEAKAGRLVHVVRAGHVHRNTLRGRLVRWLRPGIRGKVTLVNGAGLAAVAGAAQLGDWWSWGAAALALLATVFATLRLTLKPLEAILVDANRLAAGDLAFPIRTNAPGIFGTLQRAMNQLSLNLRTVIGDTRHELESVSLAVKEIAAGNVDLSERTVSQANNLQKTAAALDQINGNTSHAAESAIQGATLAEQMTEVAQRSQNAVNDVATSMSEIEDSSRRIGDIVTAIEGVAFQTGILSLNAAVEAARAGETGRGFSVVAAEVRALAQRTTDAAQQITDLISESIARVSAGSHQTVEARRRMQEAVKSVDSVSSLLREISTTADEQ